MARILPFFREAFSTQIIRFYTSNAVWLSIDYSVGEIHLDTMAGFGYSFSHVSSHCLLPVHYQETGYGFTCQSAYGHINVHACKKSIIIFIFLMFPNIFATDNDSVCSGQ